MQRRFRSKSNFGLLIAAGLLASGASARAEEDACAAFAWPLKREQAVLAPLSLATVGTGGRLRQGEAVVVKLKPMAEVAFALAPERKPKIPDAFGAVVGMDAPPKAGLYQITLSQETWLDVVQGDARLKSTAFSGKQGCASMRKSVRFDLSAAPVIVQISGAATDSVRMTIFPADGR